MYIYFAALQAKPGMSSEVAPLVAEARDVLNGHGAEATAWMASTGAPIGSFGISTRVDGAAQLIELQQKFAGADDYKAVSSKLGGLMAGPTETYLNQVVATAGDVGTVNPIVSVTRSTVLNGHLADAVGWGTKILEHVHKVTGRSGMFTTSAAGNFYDVSWVFSAAEASDLDDANTKLMADPDYIGMIDSGGAYFVPGSAQRSTIVQIP